MNITLDLNAAQLAALQNLTTQHNAAAQAALSPTDYAATVLLGLIDEQARRDLAAFRASLTPIADALATAPAEVKNDVLAYAREQLGLEEA